MTSPSAIRNVTSARLPPAVALDTFRTELGVGWWRPSKSSNFCRRGDAGEVVTRVPLKALDAWEVNTAAYAENVLHSRVSLFAQDAPVGVKSVDELLRGHHGEGVLQQHRREKETFHSSVSTYSGRKWQWAVCVRAHGGQETSCPQETQEVPDWTTPENRELWPVTASGRLCSRVTDDEWRLKQIQTCPQLHQPKLKEQTATVMSDFLPIS